MKDNVILEVKNVEKFFYGNKKLFQKDRSILIQRDFWHLSREKIRILTGFTPLREPFLPLLLCQRDVVSVTVVPVQWKNAGMNSHQCISLAKEA